MFGFGLALVVAPLTATLMTSIPVSNAALASAVNNSISRVGQPLLSAVIFIVVSGTFYAALASAVPGLDASDPAVRAAVQPLNPPAAGAPPDVAEAARVASFGALRLVAVVCAALFAAGSLVNGIGLRPQARRTRVNPGSPGRRRR